MTAEILYRPAPAIAAAVAAREISAREVATAAIERVTAENDRLGAFTDLTFERALEEADVVDAKVKAGAAPPLAGVPYGVKNLFDVAGVVTRAGSRINRDNPPAPADATVVRSLTRAGVILLGALNMGEYAYDFTGENIHDGASRNPHDPSRMSGGSSGGSGTAVAAGMVAASLGSDTNGSIRVPASFCGLFGLKPTYGRLSRAGAFPFCASLDHVGPLARSALDLALLFDALQGDDRRDPAQARRPALAAMNEVRRGAAGLRIAIAGGYFRDGVPVEAAAAGAKTAAALGVAREIELPEAARARAAAYIITAAEGAGLHLDRLRRRAADYDPAVRDRLIAGAMIPAAMVSRAQKFRRWYRDRVLALFGEVDAILAPATPCTAPLLGQRAFVANGTEMPVRANLGLYTQPISFIGLPVVVVPVPLSPLPNGVQIVVAPWREDIALRIAHALEAAGAVAAPLPAI